MGFICGWIKIENFLAIDLLDDGDDVERSSPEGVEEAPIGGGAFLGKVDQAEIYKRLLFFSWKVPNNC